MNMETYIPYKAVSISVDGASPGNPGPAGVGAVMEWVNGESEAHGFHVEGDNTNNEAEYMAVIAGLYLADMAEAEYVSVFSDSKLVVNQISGEYKVNSDHLKLLYRKVVELRDSFLNFTIEWISREDNKEADAIAKRYSKQKDSLLTDLVEIRSNDPLTRKESLWQKQTVKKS